MEGIGPFRGACGGAGHGKELARREARILVNSPLVWKSRAFVFVGVGYARKRHFDLPIAMPMDARQFR
jgi:hypothetical protein